MQQFLKYDEYKKLIENKDKSNNSSQRINEKELSYSEILRYVRKARWDDIDDYVLELADIFGIFPEDIKYDDEKENINVDDISPKKIIEVLKDKRRFKDLGVMGGETYIYDMETDHLFTVTI